MNSNVRHATIVCIANPPAPIIIYISDYLPKYLALIHKAVSVSVSFNGLVV